MRPGVESVSSTYPNSATAKRGATPAKAAATKSRAAPVESTAAESAAAAMKAATMASATPEAATSAAMTAAWPCRGGIIRRHEEQRAKSQRKERDEP